MQDYQKHGIENHPAISAEYNRFLVANSGQGAMSRFNSSIEDLEAKLKDTLSVAKVTQSFANTAQNTANEGKTIALKK